MSFRFQCLMSFGFRWSCINWSNWSWWSVGHWGRVVCWSALGFGFRSFRSLRSFGFMSCVSNWSMLDWCSIRWSRCSISWFGGIWSRSSVNRSVMRTFRCLWCFRGFGFRRGTISGLIRSSTIGGFRRSTISGFRRSTVGRLRSSTVGRLRSVMCWSCVMSHFSVSRLHSILIHLGAEGNRKACEQNHGKLCEIEIKKRSGHNIGES